MEHMNLERSIEKSSRKRKNRTVLVLLFATFVLFLITIIGTVLYVYFNNTRTTKDEKLTNMVLSNNSLAYSIWKKPNFLMKIHLFNYTNWQRVRDGLDDRLHVEDVGPYTYAQQVERVNVRVDGDKLTFQERNTFKYMPEKTTGQLHDEVNIPNLPLISLFSKAAGMNLMTQLTIESLISAFNHPHAFLKTSVEKFLWGYEDTIVDVSKTYLNMIRNSNIDRFGLLVTRNGTVSDTLTINTGEIDEDRINIIEKVDGQDYFSYWGSSECHIRPEASDGSIFPPKMLDRTTPIHVFYPFLCRRVAFEYEDDVEFGSDGLKVLRYTMPRNVFDDPRSTPANQCYCDVDTDTCLPKGVINVTACYLDAPAFASFPHFSFGDPKLTEQVTGLEPSPNLYENYVDLHPTLGIALRGKSSFQLNIQVRKKSDRPETFRFLPNELILPVAWVEIGFEREDLLSLVSSSSCLTPPMKLILMIFSIISLFIGIC